METIREPVTDDLLAALSYIVAKMHGGCLVIPTSELSHARLALRAHFQGGDGDVPHLCIKAEVEKLDEPCPAAPRK